jgi:arylformamidase
MYIDLAVTLNEQTPTFPGDAPTKIVPANRLESDGNNDHYISTNNHTGTHIDAPLHMLAGGKTLDEIPIDRFVGRGLLIEVGKEFRLEDVQQANPQEGDIVLFCTGMSEHYHEPVYFEEYPAMSEEIARYLVECKVKMVGVDTGGVDNLDGSPIHKILLAGDVLIIENLTSLNQLSGKEFTVYALPIKLDIDGAPARVVAEIK